MTIVRSLFVLRQCGGSSCLWLRATMHSLFAQATLLEQWLTSQTPKQIIMGRFETLNADTQDMVTCLLPALATAWNVKDPVDIIPEDIRMRAWDCDRRDHIKNQTENDVRNWGVQFLKDLMAIARIKKGVLDTFHADLREKVETHEDKHPWCRLSDIRKIRDEYENPNRKKPKPDEPEEDSSTDSYLEELHEPDLAPGEKRKRGHEVYEARVQPSRRKCKSAVKLLHGTSSNMI